MELRHLSADRAVRVGLRANVYLPEPGHELLLLVRRQGDAAIGRAGWIGAADRHLHPGILLRLGRTVKMRGDDGAIQALPIDRVGKLVALRVELAGCGSAALGIGRWALLAAHHMRLELDRLR